MHILLVEDDLSLQNGVSFKLNKEGYTVSCADSVDGALDLLEKNKFQMAILDITLPDGSGLTICKYIRDHVPDMHVLMLTAKDAETDIVMGYDMGADDYLTKPFSVAVLVSKCSVVARHMKEEPHIAEILLDATKQAANVRGTLVSLTRNELRLLNLFLNNVGQVLTKERLLQELWDIDGDFVDENTLPVNIRRLREKIESDPSKPVLIETMRGVGYRMTKRE